MNSLTSAVEWSRRFLAEVLEPGDFAIDATAGNGHDTLFLARQVLPGGDLWAFDIQEAAIDATARRLTEAGLADRFEIDEPFSASKAASKTAGRNVLARMAAPDQSSPPEEAAAAPRCPIRLIHCDHSQMGSLLQGYTKQPKAAVFNLGYLPGGDHALVTRAESTVSALDALAAALAEGGRLVVVVYVGHAGAEAEVTAVDRWWRQLPPQRWDTVAVQFPNRTGRPPYVLVAEKKGVQRRVPTT
ncbi:sam-dependent methyltransferase, putative [Heliomicrobium modesticaldum Ice1]|uniref:Sam-dependent methyltransferase, putative n=1 Tax=Heliobacterium modesticaldum (strain ATCC 51547 / Ice1) TaxID=498761 RepID=B0TEJ9_HELMI|nr:class I SAM-dependent methyltransferase [Heliomicrobium modesticaldum]ABZ82918.1 sam-dependent methyltransferase, putative [Heliomicrobium modesticaldum Ice1]